MSTLVIEGKGCEVGATGFRLTDVTTGEQRIWTVLVSKLKTEPGT